MSKHKSNRPTSLDALLQASSTELEEWSHGVQLEDPDVLLHEEHMAEAWLQEPHMYEEQQATAQRPFPLSAWFVRWGVAAFASCFALIVGLQVYKTERTLEPDTPDLRAKGTHIDVSTATQKLSLILGQLQADSQSKGQPSIQRLSERAHIAAKHSIVFSFRLSQPGYIYLFVQSNARSVRMIYPMKSHTQKLWQSGFSNLEYQQRALVYGLGQHRGPTSFTLVWSADPLFSSTYRLWIQSLSLVQSIQRWNQTHPSRVLYKQVKLDVHP